MTTSERQATLQGFFAEARRLAALVLSRRLDILRQLPSLAQFVTDGDRQ